MGGKAARGVLCALFGAALWGLSGVCASFLFSNYEISPLFVTMTRALGAGIIFLVMILLRYRTMLRKMLLDAHAVASLIVFGCLGLFPCQIVYLVTVDLTNAGTATVFQSLNIVFIAVFTAAVAHKPLCRNEILGVVVSFCSVFVIATQGNPLMLAMPLDSLLWCLFLGLVESFYVVYPEKLFSRFGSFAPTGIAMLISGLLSAAIWLFSSLWSNDSGIGFAIPEMDAWGMMVLAVIVIFGTFVSFALFLGGVSRVGAVTGSLMGAMEPLSAAVLSALLLATPFSKWDWLGLILMVTTFFLVAKWNGKKDGVAD